MKHYSIILGALLASCFLFACTQKEEEQKEIPVESVMISQPTLEITLGQSYRLSAKVFPSNATNPEVEWTSSNSLIAHVYNGIVTPLSEGKATIYATAGSKRDQCEVTVVGEFANKTVSSITLNKNETTIKGFESETLVATVLFTDGTTTSHANWSSSNETIATVSNGYVFGINNGDVTITAEFGGKTASCLVHVIESSGGYVPVTSVTLDQTSITIKAWTVYTLVATVKPDNATDKTVHWESSDPNVAHVEDGVVMGMQDGTAIITAKAGDKTATCVVTVQEETVAVESITLNKTSLSLKVGESYTLKATVNPYYATNKTVTWECSNNSVATVNDGVVTAISQGTATITARAGNKSATCYVSVQQDNIPVTGITLNKYSLSLYEGESENLIATVYPTNATDKTVTWSSEVTSVASVDQNGKVTAIKNGTTTIIARAGGYEARCTLVVEPPQGSVDLGLSVKWASCNLGASYPEGTGDYYAWGEILPYYQDGHGSDNPCGYWRDGKTGYNWDSYKYYNNGGITKYCDNTSTAASHWSGEGQPDGKTRLDLEDDVANILLKGNWHIPSKSEWQELQKNCTLKEVTRNGVTGLLCTSRINGNSIFFPVCYYRKENKMSNVHGVYNITSNYHYWTSERSSSYSPEAALFTTIIDIKDGPIRGKERYIGMVIRPVTK